MASDITALAGLEPCAFWAHLGALTRIAPPSRHEGDATERVRRWAGRHAFALRQDENAPRDATAVCSVAQADADAFREAIAASARTIRNAFATGPELSIAVDGAVPPLAGRTPEHLLDRAVLDAARDAGGRAFGGRGRGVMAAGV